MKHSTMAAFVLVCWGSFNLFAEGLPRSSPEEQGVSSAEVMSFIEAADQQLDSLHSLMLVRHGHVVAEGWWSPYHPAARHSLYSLSKSFTSTAIGLAISEGKLSLDDPVIKFFPDDCPPVLSDNLKAMRVSDLLRMATGHQTEPPRSTDVAWTESFLAHPVPFKPGTHFLYNTSATYMQSAIVQKATGMNLVDYLKPRLFDPLGIENPSWEFSPQGIATGGYGLSVRTEEIAKFGQLYLQQGKWSGVQLVPESWIHEATSRQVANGSNPASDWDQGYGYQFWRCRYGAYRGDGAFGQYCLVLPEQDAVIAITSGLKDMQEVLNLVWEKLLPAMKPTALPANPADHEKLQQRLKKLAIRPQSGSSHPPAVLGHKYVFAPGEHKLEAIRLEAVDQAGHYKLMLRFDGVESVVSVRNGEWTLGRTGWETFRDLPVATSGGFTSDDTLTVKLCFYETPFTTTVELKFQGDEVRLETRSNLSFGGKTDFQLLGITGSAVSGSVAK